MKQIAVLGSTGSIGTQTLDVVRAHGDELSVAALAAGQNIKKLREQIREFHPTLVSVKEESAAENLRRELSGTGITVLSGMDGLIAAAGCPQAELVVTAVVGMMGILPTMEAIRWRKTVALANKETLVTAGHLIMPMAREYGVSILPVDSEHSAVFQCLHHERHCDVDRIILTASGGPFRGKTLEELARVTPEEALRHPNWNMGKKVTIDSSTMVNKGLEIMEAHWLFGVDYEDIAVLLQPQSIIHSMVQFVDGAVLAQLGTPDMHIPIEYALFYPERRPLQTEKLDFAALRSLSFEEPDRDVFRGLSLAAEAGRIGGTMPTVFNAANERAVALFLEKKIGYLDIVRLIDRCMEAHAVKANPSVEEILSTEQWVYTQINGLSSL